VTLARIGFVGLGSQGGPMARRIIDAGYPTTVWARRAETLEPFGDARVVPSLVELGATSDILCICVIDDAGVDEVLRGPDGALAGMVDGGVVTVHSTVHPSTCVRLQQDFPDLCVVDAPVSGGGHKAAAGELLVMVGGRPEVVERCRPVLETFGDPVIHVGPLGAGQEAKVLNNTVFTAQLALAAETFELAAARQLSPAAVATILASGSGRSYAAEVVAGGGFGLEGLAGFAGALLAKDVGILAAMLGGATGVPGGETSGGAIGVPGGVTLLAAADAALARMGVART
jgi:3-hydroxyisobutyrate dehydrogenase